jgi:hypothetical protein
MRIILFGFIAVSSVSDPVAVGLAEVQEDKF